MITPYFTAEEGAPAPLRATVSGRARFEGFDPPGIVWHGRYASYFEDARVALTDRYGIGYLDLIEKGVVAPIRKLHVDYFRSLRFRETFAVEAVLHWTEVPRLNMEFTIQNEAREVATTGYTVQLMLDADRNLLMLPPPFYRDFLDRWRKGGLA